MHRRALPLAILAGVVALSFSGAQEGTRNLDQSKNISSSANEKLHREGTRMDHQDVTFRAENDRLMVQFGHDNKPIQVLENLASQRIYRANRDDPDDKRWTISGVLTEFEGRNYLLIEQAVRIR